MNIDIIKAKEYILQQNKKHLEAAEDYKTLCVEYGKKLKEHQRLIANRIMTYKEQKKNLGIEMAVLMALADTGWPECDYFREINDKMCELKYTREGMKRLLDAYESEKISIQSLMKYDAQGERLY